MADIKIYGKLKNATESGKVANYSDIDGAPEIVQETGQSTEKTMSQKAITDAINSGGGAVYSVIEISTSQTVLTDEQYNTLIASPFNKIKSGNIICDLYQETSTELVYTANYFNTGHRVTITKATKGVTRGSLSSLTSISSYVKNSLDYNQSNTTYALSAYQGKVLNDRLIALENSGGGAVYSVIEISTSQTVLTDEQYNTLIASPFNKIKSGNIICDLYQETSTELVYTANYFNTGHRVTITKATKGVTRGSLSSLTSISSYVKNSLDYNQSNTTYALSAYQGKVLNDRLIALENSGGGGGSGSASDGFNNLKALNLTPTTYQGTESPSGKFAFRGTGGYTLKDNSSGTITTIVQLPVVPGEGIRFAETADGKCEISATGGESKPILVLNTSEALSDTNYYDRTYYTWPAVDAAGIDNHEYNVIIYDQTSGGGYYYCPLTSDDMTWIGQARPTGDISPYELAGWTYKGRESETAASFWRDEWSKQPISALYLHNLTITSDYDSISTAVYSSRSTQFDLITFISKYSGTLRVNGEFTTQSKQYFISRMLVNSVGTIEVYYLNGTTRTSKTITPTTIIDTVKEV